MRYIPSIALTLASFAFLTGCTTSDSTKTGQTFDSPNAVFAAAQEAAKSEDYAALMRCIKPESRGEFAGMMTLGAVMAKEMAQMSFTESPGIDGAEVVETEDSDAPDFSAVDAVLNKHGLTEEVLKKFSEEPANVDSDPTASIAALVEPVKDKPAFVGELMKALDSVSDEKSPMSFPTNGGLDDLKIDGDTAVGQVSDGDRKAPMHFAKSDGSWYLLLK